MATNHYFNNLRAVNEQSLIEDLVIETIKIHGMDIFYLPRTILVKDKIFGEDAVTKFGSNRVVEIYVDSVNGFEGPQDILSKFGLQVKDNATFTISKKRFQKETGMERPMEGDIIYLPMTKGFFEIKYVEHEAPFYQLGKNYVFKLNVELFEFSEEYFSTGEKEIDDFAADRDFNVYLSITGPRSGVFSVGDLVYQYSNGAITGSYTAANAYGKIFDTTSNQLTINDVKGKWLFSDLALNRYVTVKDTTSYAKIDSISDKVMEKIYNDNKILEEKADQNLNFDIKNPFGDP